MKTVLLAYSQMGCTALKSLLVAGYEVQAVFTHKDDPSEWTWFDSVAELAAAHNIPVFAPDDINHPLWVKRIKDINPDVIFSVYYRKLVKQPILDIPRLGCLNLHGSLLPKFRGRCPVNWVLIQGEKETGVTLHYMTPKADDGDIVAQTKVGIAESDTARTLFDKLLVSAEGLLKEILPAIKAGKAPRLPQDQSKASYFGGRRPEDGQIDWTKSAKEVRNLIRAVTKPYPGAFTFLANQKCFIWSATETAGIKGAGPGEILSINPLVISCGQGALQVDYGQSDGSIHTTGAQLANELNLVAGVFFGEKAGKRSEANRRKKVLILGVNGFIGNALSERLLASGRYEVHGLDLNSDSITRLLDHPNFHFFEGDISVHREWIEYNIMKCDVIIPLVAIATPIEYTRNPLRVFELDFEENLRIIRYCVKYKKRIIFPSTSEVYGMCTEEEFDEDNSQLVLGPIRMQRWIYSSIKQLLDRVIWAYGQKEDLKFTLFRPFNWMGPRLDSLTSARIGSSRAITQLILNLVEGTPILLIDGGHQKRCFTDVSDGVECLFRLIEDKRGTCNQQIVNIGNPTNEASIRELAEMLVAKFEVHPLRNHFPPFAGFKETESGAYYGAGYQDTQHRRPSIKNAKRIVNWEPKVGMDQSVEGTLDFFLKQAVSSNEFRLRVVDGKAAKRAANE